MISLLQSICIVLGFVLAFGGGAAYSQTIKAAMHSDLKILDPLVATAYIVRNHGFMVWDQLLAFDEKGVVRPQMAERWEVSKNGLVYTFTLRDGLEWHDGTPVTSEDCIASIQRFNKRDSSGIIFDKYIEKFETVNPKSFRIVLKEAYGLTLETLAKNSLAPLLMMPKKVAETPPTEQISPEKVIGSGPFIFKRDEWRPGEKVVYVKNNKYKPRSEPASGFAGGKVAYVDRVEWVVIPDIQTGLAALSNGEIDFVEMIPFEMFSLVNADKGLKLKPGTRQQYTLRPNHLNPPFDNPKIRQAAMIALSQEELLIGMVGDKRFYNTCQSIYFSDSPNYTDAGMKDMVRGDYQRAQKLLKEAGYDGTPLVIPYATDVFSLNVGPLIKHQLERGGFKVELAACDWMSLATRLRSKKKAADGGWSAYVTCIDHVDAQNPIFRYHLNTDCKTSITGWPCDDEMEKVREAFARSTTEAAKKKLARQVQERNAEVVAIVPIGEFRWSGACRRNIQTTFEHPITLFYGLKKN